jgi:uncharacterized membrane-anchored protein YhcB (DUF1043 family)
MMIWSEMIFAIVITAIAGSLLQDALLPNFLRQAKETPMKTKPEMTDPSILAMVLDEMESLNLIKLSPNAEKIPLIKGKLQTEDQHMSEKAAALILEQQEKQSKLIARWTVERQTA